MRLGVLDGHTVVVSGDRAANVRWASQGRLPTDPMALLEDWPRVRDWAAGLPDDAYDIPVDPTALGAPVPRPRQVFAVALNYPPHAAEAGFTPPEDPLVFTKFPACVTGPHTSVSLPRARSTGKPNWSRWSAARRTG